VVDDDGPFLRSVGRLLRSSGHHVRTFGSGQEYLADSEATRCGCLVVDVHMPGMSGLDLYDRVSALGVRVPVIFMTAHDTPETRARARLAGSFALLLKPFDKGLLFKAIEEALGSSGSPGVRG